MTVENQAPAFERLHALARKGYKPNIGAKEGDEKIVLRHLGKAPDLILHPNGVVEEFDGRRPWHKRHVPSPGSIPAARDADHLQFMKFLETVPRPTFLDRTRPFRKKYVYVPTGLLAFWGICFSFTALILS